MLFLNDRDTSRRFQAKSSSHIPLKGLVTFLMVLLAGPSEDNFLQVHPLRLNLGALIHEG